MIPKPPEYIEETDAFIAGSVEKMKRGEEAILVVLDKKTKEFLGIVGVHRLNTVHPELGVWIKLGAHGHTYGREAVTAAKQWMDAQGFAYEYMEYPVDKRNVSSRKIAESLGGVAVREFKKGELPARPKLQRSEGGDEVEYRIYKNT
jgi:RimJ/RimL family protein N-acetyltransferase